MLVWQAADGHFHSVHLHNHISVLWVQVNIASGPEMEKNVFLSFPAAEPPLHSCFKWRLTCQQVSHWYDSVQCDPSSKEPWISVPWCNPVPEPGSKTMASRSCISCCWMLSGSLACSCTRLWGGKKWFVPWHLVIDSHRRASYLAMRSSFTRADFGQDVVDLIVKAIKWDETLDFIEWQSDGQIERHAIGSAL